MKYNRKTHSIITVILFIFICVKYQNIKPPSTEVKVSVSPPRLRDNSMNETMEERYKKLRSRIKEVCQKYNKTKELSNAEVDALKKQQISSPQNTVMDMVSKLAYCQIPKVGTSTWMEHFRKLLSPELQKITKHWSKRSIIQSSFKIPVDLLKNISTLPENQQHSFVNTFNKFLKENDILSFAIVRHPFERLVSFYRSDIGRSPKVGAASAKLLGLTKWYNTGHTFPAFIDLVLKQYRDDKCYGLYSYPCFGVNPHWTPFHSLCLFCDVEYYVVGRLETFSEDVKYIFKKSNLTKLENDYAKVLHSSNKNQFKLESKSKKKKEVQRYFSYLTKKQVYGLYQMYRMDFEMFNYDANTYLDMANISNMSQTDIGEQ